MSKVKSIAVFCGSSDGTKPVFKEAAYNLGKSLAEHGISLVYGGGSRGLMGSCARGCSENKGHVIGVIPKFLYDVPAVKPGVYESELIVTKNMHERKSIMCERADAFIALPGGIGTFEEIFEQMAWLQLRLHNKVCGFLNVDGFYNDLKNFLLHAVDNGFTRQAVFDSVQFESNPDMLIEKIEGTTINLPPKIC